VHPDGVAEDKQLCMFLDHCEDIITMLVEDEGHYLLVDFARRDPMYRELVRDAWESARKELRDVRDTIAREYNRYVDRLRG